MTYDPFDPFNQLLTETPAHLLAAGHEWVKQQFYDEVPVIESCANCASLQEQNTELDRKLADYEQTSGELCEVCGWRFVVLDRCLNCEKG